MLSKIILSRLVNVMYMIIKEIYFYDSRYIYPWLFKSYLSLIFIYIILISILTGEQLEPLNSFDNRIIIIEYQFPRFIMKYNKIFSYPSSTLFLCNKKSLSLSRISANHDKVEGHSANSEILI